MFTLDASRKVITKDKIVFSHHGFQPIDNNSKGVFILHQESVGHWMSVPQKAGGVKLYPMKKVEALTVE